jgi:hypothetical protein
MKNGTKNLMILTAIVMFAATLSHSGDLDKRHTWTTIGSAGTPDESDLGDVSMNNGVVSLNPGAPAGSAAVIRYNITATDALVGDMSGRPCRLKVAYRDAGSNGSVKVFVMQTAVGRQPARAILSFDSDAHDGRASSQIRRSTVEAMGQGFDFEQSSYYLAVVLEQDAQGLSPAFVGASLAPAEYVTNQRGRGSPYGIRRGTGGPRHTFVDLPL